MSDTVKSLVDAIQTAVGALSGWQLSRVHPAAFAMDSRPMAHLGFAVHAPASSMREERQRNSEGALTTTTITVTFSARIRADAAAEDADLAYTHEATMIAAVVALKTSMHIALTSVSRTVAGDATYSIHAVTLTVIHLFPLT